MLFGLPFRRLPDDERDRVDMVVERMMPADVALLHGFAEKDRTARSPTEETPYIFRGSKLVAFVRGIEVRIASTDDGPDGEFEEATYSDPRLAVDHAAFASLLRLGCVEIPDAKASYHTDGGDWQIHTVLITPLGRLVIEAIAYVRPGFEGIVAADAPNPGTRP